MRTISNFDEYQKTMQTIKKHLDDLTTEEFKTQSFLILIYES